MSGRPAGPRTLGVLAVAIAAVGLLSGAALVFWGGIQLGSGYAAIGAAPGSVLPDDVPPATAALIRTGGMFMLAGWSSVVVLGLWSFVQALVALAQNRGRRWAVAAIAIGVLSGIVVLGVFAAGVGIGTG